MNTPSIIPPPSAAGVIETDALVIGAGPAGLYAVFQLGLQGIHTHVVDVLDEAGGQCIELYPDKPIYDIPGLVRCTGRELTQHLLQQVSPFQPTFHFGQQVSQVSPQADGRWLVATTQCTWLARTVLIAAGVGAFVPKTLKVDGLDAFTDRQVHHRLKSPGRFQGQRVMVVGGEDAAVEAAISLATGASPIAHSVTLVHRRDVLQASPQALSALAELRASGRVQFMAGQVIGIQVANDRLLGVQVTTPQDTTMTLALDDLLVCQGISPKLGPVADWGLAMARKQLSVSTDTFATSAPGIFAVGDVIAYPGKKKLIVCGFHEATLAAFAMAAHLHPETSGVLQYTSSSALLQQRLGVADSGLAD